MNNILFYLKELDLTETERRFFIGWCEEGGTEFIDILDAVVFTARTIGYDDGSSRIGN